MSRRDRQRRRRRNRGSPLKRVLGLTAVLMVAGMAVGGLAIAGWVINVAQSAPNLSSIHPTVPGSPSEIFAADGQSLGYIWSPTVHTPLPGAEIPSLIKQATIAIEDRRFYHHGALDYQGIVRAAIKDAVSGHSLQGASTLTMQLVDNEYLPREYQSARKQHDLKYKIVQAKLAEQLEGEHSKAWILDSYLNDVPYGTVGGQTVYGVGAASQMFFDKPVQKLTLDQAALLAGLPQAPSEYNPFLDRGAALHRRAEVLQAMVTAGDITQAQADAAGRRPLAVHVDDRYTYRRDPYVFDFVEQQLAQDLCPQSPGRCPKLTQGGMKIYTTIDLRKQALALQAIRNHESLLAEQNPQYGSAAAGLASIDNANGHILAIASSSDYSQTKFDYATDAYRQTGSAFKVFALMELIHDYHANPSDTYYTSKLLPAGWYPGDPTWTVHTAEDSYQGTISVAKATTVSDNTVFAQLAVDMGIPKLNDIAHAMGITSPLDDDPAEVLGGLHYGVTPLQMADAYATIADGGTHIPATIIGKVVFPDGSTANYGNPPRTAVFPYNQTYEADQVLKTVITSGTGTAAGYGCPAAGKTGTANNFNNAWFVGFTPRMSTAVWVGYPQGNIEMADGYGGTLAAPIWHDYMQAASSGYCGDWTPPTVPFEGTAFVGAHTATTPAPSTSTRNGNGSANTTAKNPTNQYNNPTLFSTPPQTGSGTGASTGSGGKHHGGGSPNGGTGVGH